MANSDKFHEFPIPRGNVNACKIKGFESNFLKIEFLASNEKYLQIFKQSTQKIMIKCVVESIKF